jgi:hypothetical protein
MKLSRKPSQPIMQKSSQHQAPNTEDNFEMICFGFFGIVVILVLGIVYMLSEYHANKKRGASLP